MFYPQEIIEQVIEANNIVDVISEYVKLTKKGSTYFGLCPFHNEKTPSFAVTDSADKRMFYCFGCHAGGNVLTFLMKYENYSYSEAMKVLADRAGITLPQPQYSKEDSAKYQLKEKVLEVYRHAAVYYFHLLKSDRGTAAYDYLKNRQLTDETIVHYGLGYSDKYRDDLYRYIRSKGYSDDVLKATGLFSIREQGVHDYFWNRVMFPIMDVRNRVIAFGGRVMGEGEPKYLNSPETIVFEKKKTLFGLNIAKKHKGSDLILCEGYMDVISLHQAGFTNAVASLGTALTQAHAGILKRYTSGVALSYDSDNAGRNAALRAIPILRDVGLNVKVIDLSPYKDPDELIKAMGPGEYKNRVKNARNGLLFEIDMLKEAFDMNDPDSKTNFYNETARRLSFLDDEIERENYLRTVSSEFDIDYNLLKNRTVKYALTRGNTGNRSRYSSDNSIDSVQSGEGYGRSGKRQDALLKSYVEVLRFLANHPVFYEQVSQVIGPEDFLIDPYNIVALNLYSQLKSGRINISGIIGSFADEQDQEKAASVFGSAGEDDHSAEYKKFISDCVVNIKRYSLEERLNAENDIMKVITLRKEMEQLGQIAVLK